VPGTECTTQAVRGGVGLQFLDGLSREGTCRVAGDFGQACDLALKDS
jgi:hypothetical protein